VKGKVVFAIPILHKPYDVCVKSLEASLPLIEAAAYDDRNFVKKGVNWALRAIGERSIVANAAAVALAERLAQSEAASARPLLQSRSYGPGNRH